MLSLEIRSSNFNKLKSSFILIKVRNLPLEPSRSIPQQLQLVSLLLSDASTSEDSRQSTYLHNMQQVTRYLFTPMTKTLASIEQVSDLFSN